MTTAGEVIRAEHAPPTGIGTRVLQSGARESARERRAVGEVGLAVVAGAALLVLKLGWVDRFDSPWRLSFDGQQLPVVSSPPAANFGDVLTLLGYRLSTTRARPGDSVEVTLYWNAPDPLTGNYGSYTHLIDPLFRMYAQSENSVLDFATSRSSGPATYIEDRHRLVVPRESPAGKYWIEVGAYPSGEGRRLPILDASGQTLGRQLLLAPIKVFDPARRTPAPAHPLDVNFEDSVRLLGYDLEPEGLVVVPPGKDTAEGVPTTLHVTLYWQALNRLPQDLTVFVHLRDAAGRLVTQHDGQPDGGRFPTTFWEPGEFIVDEHILEIATPAAAGAYTLTVGLYDPQTGERLRVLGPEEPTEGDAARLGDVTIAEPRR